MFQSMFYNAAMRRAVELVLLSIFVIVWLSGCAGMQITVPGNQSGNFYPVTQSGNFTTANYNYQNQINNPNNPNNFNNNCSRMCNAMGVCTSNPALYPQLARSGAVCAPNGNSVTGNQQIHNCKSGGQGTAEQCRANDAAANGNQNQNQNQNNGRIYNCKSGGQSTAEVCRARDAASGTGQSQQVACKSGGTQPTIAACQKQDLQYECSRGNKQACDIQKRM